MRATTNRRLWALFQIILAGGAGGGGAGCSSVSRDNFTEDTCTGKSFEPLSAIEPREAVDYVEVDGPETGPPRSRGVKCEKAVDQKACLAAFEAMVKVGTDPNNGSSPQLPPGFRGFDIGGVVFRFTRGDTIGEIRTIEALRGLMDAKSPKSAMLFAWVQGHDPACGEKNAGAQDQNFVVLTHTGSTCGGDVKENRVTVNSKGDLTIVETDVYKSGDPNCQIGRRPEGFEAGPYDRGSFAEWLAALAELEAASIPAFERLARELELHHAPVDFVERAKLSARDEARHARMMSRLALDHGADSIPTASSNLQHTLETRSSLFAVIKENAIEGCVRETFGALVAAHQAKHADNPRIRSIMKAIANDETRHAALAWDIAAWALPLLTRDERAAIETERRQAVEQLRAALAAPASSLPVAALTKAGMPTAARSRAMLDQLLAAVDELAA